MDSASVALGGAHLPLEMIWRGYHTTTNATTTITASRLADDGLVHFSIINHSKGFTVVNRVRLRTDAFSKYDVHRYVP